MQGVAGIGIDLAEVERVRRALERRGERFLARILSPPERDELRRRGLSADAAAAFVAGRFAAKEAIGKAIGTGVGRLGWANVTVGADELGRPTCRLCGPALLVARDAGADGVLVSISHTGGTVAACAVALKGGDGCASPDLDRGTGA